MQLWLARDGAVPLREQLVTQIKLAIAARQLAPGSKLPSTRELARRYRVHANTVSAAYQQLEAEQWIELRHGSGVYVREREMEPIGNDVDSLMLAVTGDAMKRGISRSELLAAFRREANRSTQDQLQLVEPDTELAAILLAECALAGIRLQRSSAAGEARFVVCRSSTAQMLASRAHITTLRFNAISEAIQRFLPLPRDRVIAIASSWQGFLDAARTVLFSAGVPEDALLLLDASDPDWKARAQSAAAVICDVLVAEQLQRIRSRVIAFPLLSTECLREVRTVTTWLAS